MFSLSDVFTILFSVYWLPSPFQFKRKGDNFSKTFPAIENYRFRFQSCESAIAAVDNFSSEETPVPGQVASMLQQSRRASSPPSGPNTPDLSPLVTSRATGLQSHGQNSRLAPPDRITRADPMRPVLEVGIRSFGVSLLFVYRSQSYFWGCHVCILLLSRAAAGLRKNQSWWSMSRSAISSSDRTYSRTPHD